MKKTLSVVYGVSAYVFFLGTFLALIAFTMDMGPFRLSGEAAMPAAMAVMVDVGLVLMFGLQHSIMARAGFKERWTRIVPKHLERSTFVVIASVMVWLMIAGWQPIDGELWHATGPMMMVLYGLSAAGFMMVPVVSFLTDHFELFGLRQIMTYAMGRPLTKPVFRERGLYKNMRHPMMLGFLVAFWATPAMTMSHLLFAVLMTAYIMAGIYFEERSLASEHGAAYLAYQSRVPKLLPRGKTPRLPEEVLAALREAEGTTH